MRATGHVLVVFGALAAVTGVALALGAPDLGTALSFGQMAFAAALMLVLVRS